DEDTDGCTENSFELCLGIFCDTCRRAGGKTQFYKDALFLMFKGSTREYYHLYLMNNNLTFDEMTTRLKAHFETAERQEQMLSKWKNLSLKRLIEEKPTISYAECFETLVEELPRTKLSLPNRYEGDESLRDAVVDAVRDVRECSFVLPDQLMLVATEQVKDVNIYSSKSKDGSYLLLSALST
ncbi:putative glycosyl, partial [Golovinomyces cichoracearum]